MKTIEQLQEENAALSAQLVAIQDAALKPRGKTRQQWIDNIKRNALSITAREHLAEIRAQAVERAISLYTHKLGSDEELNEVGITIIRKHGEYIHPEGLREYVKQLLNGTDGQYADSIRQDEVK